jgi:hypothetical protein
MSARRLMTCCALLLAGRSLSAQVGYPPDRSPFRDLPETMEASMYSGWFRAKRDPGGVTPRSGPILGAMYQWRMGGPSNLVVEVGRVATERRVLDPERLGTCAGPTPTSPPDTSVACKSIGNFRWPLYLLDVGYALNVTGARSFFNLIPQARAGIGLASDFHTSPDVGDFAFGTRFALNWGAGIRWIPGGGRYQVRADVLNRLYTVKYPATYYAPSDDGSTIFTPRQNRTAWLNNPTLTFGVSYLFSR